MCAATQQNPGKYRSCEELISILDSYEVCLGFHTLGKSHSWEVPSNLGLSVIDLQRSCLLCEVCLGFGTVLFKFII
jgi:hypothetical protein